MRKTFFLNIFLLFYSTFSRTKYDLSVYIYSRHIKSHDIFSLISIIPIGLNSTLDIKSINFGWGRFEYACFICGCKR